MKASSQPPTCRAVPEPYVQASIRRRNFLLSAWTGACTLATAHLPHSAIGAPTPGSQQDTPALYDAFAKEYDNLDDGSAASLFGFPALRQRMLSAASGRVLECGSGTGAPHVLPWTFLTTFRRCNEYFCLIFALTQIDEGCVRCPTAVLASVSGQG